MWEIPVYERKKDFNDKGKRCFDSAMKAGKISFNAARLAHAFIYTTLCKYPSASEAALLAFSHLAQIRAYVLRGVHEFRLNDLFYDYLDFSLTTRVGELAQAINFIFAQDFLGYPTVVDFRYYCENVLHISIPANQSAPDFIISRKGRSSDYALLESKGAGSYRINAINKAIEQCERGRSKVLPKIIPQNCYASSVKFPKDKPAELHFTDPDFSDNKIEIDLAGIYYSTWFAAAGDFDTARALLNTNRYPQYEGSSFRIKRPISERVRIDSHTINLLSRDFINTSREGSFKVTLGIEENIFEALSDNPNAIAIANEYRISPYYNDEGTRSSESLTSDGVYVSVEHAN